VSASAEDAPSRWACPASLTAHGHRRQTAPASLCTTPGEQQRPTHQHSPMHKELTAHTRYVNRTHQRRPHNVESTATRSRKHLKGRVRREGERSTGISALQPLPQRNKRPRNPKLTSSSSPRDTHRHNTAQTEPWTRRSEPRHTAVRRQGSETRLDNASRSAAPGQRASHGETARRAKQRVSRYVSERASEFAVLAGLRRGRGARGWS
jgi:hypothetical protein